MIQNKMKFAGFTLLLFLSVFTFGQSAKKMNAKLRSELADEQRKQDSVQQVFSQLNNQVTDLQTEFGKQKERFITESSNTLFYRDSISRVKYDLKRLGEAPDLKDVESYLEMSNGWYFLQSMISKKKKLEPLESVSGIEGLDELELKKQNELLNLKIAQYREKAAFNKLHMRGNESGVKELKSAIALLDSASLVYENATKILLAKKRTLDSQLNGLRENYRLKGPKGFPDAYRTVFPDIHPLPKVEVTSEPYDRDEGFTDVPPPVESSRVVVQEPEIYSVVDEMAEFPGGIGALRKYMTDNLRYPEKAKEIAISGKVYLQFVVSRTGDISNVKLLRGLPDCKECDAEAIRLVKSMPMWKPGRQNGKAVDSYFNLPVEFKIN